MRAERHKKSFIHDKRKKLKRVKKFDIKSVKYFSYKFIF